MEEKFEFEQSQKFAEVFRFLSKVARNWYWVLLVFLIGTFSAYMIVRYENPVYVVQASFITKKFEDNSSGIAGLLDANPFKQRIEVYQEIPLLKSEDKIKETLNRLNFGVSYFVEGRLKTTEIYKNYNYTVINDSLSKNIPYDAPIFIEEMSNGNKYSLKCEYENINRLFVDKTFDFGKKVKLDGWIFTIKKNKEPDSYNGYSYYFVINNPYKLLNEYRQKLNITWARQGSAILNASLESEVPEKEYDFLTTYIDVIIEKGLEEKNQHLINTIAFINDYMGHLSDTLVRYQNKIDKFKLENRELINGSGIIMEKLASIDEQRTNLLLENRYYDYIIDYIKDKKQSEVFAPNLIGIEAPLLNQLMSEYIDIKWMDKIDLNESNKKNPLVNKNNEEFERVEKNIYESIKNRKEANLKEIKVLNEQADFYYNSIAGYQVESRQYDELQRMLTLYQGLFNTLLSKRTDASIAKASTTSDYQEVTAPYYSSVPVHPDSDKIYLILMLSGLGLPLAFMYLQLLFNEKIISKEDLKKQTNIPLIGGIGHSLASSDKVIMEMPKSNVSEAFRGIRANLQYFTRGQEESKVFLITSSISSEGKTFCSMNLAYTFAITGKKTLLLGADLRKPSMSKSFDLRREKGLSNYLAGLDELEDVIYPSDHEKLSVLPAGSIPPNPAELLSSHKMDGLIGILRAQFDVIVIDTPPIGLVADTLELIKQSDTNLLIVRQGKTYKKSLVAITELYNEGKVQNLGILFNDIDFNKYEYGKGYGGYGNKYGYSYGYGYGYYYDSGVKKKKGWMRKLFKK